MKGARGAAQAGQTEQAKQAKQAEQEINKISGICCMLRPPASGTKTGVNCEYAEDVLDDREATENAKKPP